jgi:hypothetical protein
MMATKKWNRGNQRIGELGIKTRFQPGVSGNPGGRPKTRILAEMLAAVGDQVEAKSGKTYFQLAAEALVGKAFNGDVQAFREFADRIDGRATQHVELSGRAGGSITIDSGKLWMEEWQSAPIPRRLEMERELEDKILAEAAKIVAKRNIPDNEKQYRTRMREFHDRTVAGENAEIKDPSK